MRCFSIDCGCGGFGVWLGLLCSLYLCYSRLCVLRLFCDCVLLNALVSVAVVNSVVYFTYICVVCHFG